MENKINLPTMTWKKVSEEKPKTTESVIICFQENGVYFYQTDVFYSALTNRWYTFGYTKMPQLLEKEPEYWFKPLVPNAEKVETNTDFLLNDQIPL